MITLSLYVMQITLNYVTIFEDDLCRRQTEQYLTCEVLPLGKRIAGGILAIISLLL